MNAGWSKEQRHLLAALGYTLYESATVPSAMDGRDVVSPKGAGRSVAVADPSEQIHRAPTVLWNALLRAARIGPLNIAEADGWLRARQVPSLAHLRRDPAAKRALWPILRALRRSPLP